MIAGTHFLFRRLDRFFSTSTQISHLSKNNIMVDKVLSSISDSTILNLLEKEKRINELNFTHHVHADGDARGQYNRETRNIDIQLILSPGSDFAFPVGKPTLTVSQLASTEYEALRRTLIHEVAHHLQQFINFQSDLVKDLYKGWESAKASNFSVSTYALTLPGEYWAETMTAYLTDQTAGALDPKGIALVERILSLL